MAKLHARGARVIAEARTTDVTEVDGDATERRYVRMRVRESKGGKRELLVSDVCVRTTPTLGRYGIDSGYRIIGTLRPEHDAQAVMARYATRRGLVLA